MATKRGRADASGFTMLELITVLGLLSVLMGIGIGFLQRGSTDLDVALAIVRDQMRVAANTAKARRLPTEVHILPGDVGQPTALQARLLTGIGFWHLEPGEKWIDASLRPDLTGTPEPNGRFGAAMRPDPEVRSAMLSVPGGSLDLEYGFALRLELKLEHHAAMNVARLGRALDLSLDDDLRPDGKVTLADPGPRPGIVVHVRGDRPLRTGVWTTIELIHDGRTLVLLVDDRREGIASARGGPFQQPGDAFEVSFGGAPVIGLVDEIQLLAYEYGERVDLPDTVELRGLQGPVRFGRRGELLAPERFTLQMNDVTHRRIIAPGGVLQPWPEEKKP